MKLRVKSIEELTVFVDFSRPHLWQYIRIISKIFTEIRYNFLELYNTSKLKWNYYKFWFANVLGETQKDTSLTIVFVYVNWVFLINKHNI